MRFQFLRSAGFYSRLFFLLHALLLFASLAVCYLFVGNAMRGVVNGEIALLSVVLLMLSIVMLSIFRFFDYYDNF